VARAAVGIKPHTGWAAAVTLYGSASSPSVCDRRRLDLSDPVLPRAVFHAARALDLDDAEKLVRRRTEAAEASAQRVIRALVNHLEALGHEVVAGAIVLGRGRPAANLAEALSSHIAVHTAEGELYRRALIRGGEDCGLRVTCADERDLYESLAGVLQWDADHVRSEVSSLGRGLGPPWAGDQKSAALAAWLALASAPGSS
jgi:hypothetical protein